MHFLTWTKEIFWFQTYWASNIDNILLRQKQTVKYINVRVGLCVAELYLQCLELDMEMANV